MKGKDKTRKNHWGLTSIRRGRLIDVANIRGFVEKVNIYFVKFKIAVKHNEKIVRKLLFLIPQNNT